MAGKIPQPFIDQVINQTDIVDLIDGYVELKQKGREYTACCPFHSEKTPSFTVSPDKQFYHCFGCGAHGTAISFLMEHEGLQFVEAIEVLATKLGLQVPQEAGFSKSGENQNQFRALNLANQYYRQQLRNNKTAIRYLKQRGITGSIADLFDIGYAPEGFDNLKREFSNSIELKTLEQVGLLAKKDGDRTYDRFRGRIMFPIKDTRGRVIAFGGRALGDAMPKYINSPETALFHKSKSLYGLYEARQSRGKISQLIIVEGYMDVVALAQNEIRNCVATLGTATNSQHVSNLLRYSSDLVFCFDGDRAGNAAAWRALEQILPEYKDGIDIRFAFMPLGEDPDSLIRNSGKDTFLQHIQQSLSLSEYFFKKLTAEIDTATPDGRAKLANLAKPLLSKLPACVFKDLMLKELNQRVGTTVAQPSALQMDSNSRPVGASATRTPKYTKTRLAIALLLREPRLAKFALPIEDLTRLNVVPGIPLLIQMLDIIENNSEISSIVLLERFRGEDAYPHLQKLLEWDPPDMANREASFRGTMNRLQDDIRRAGLDAMVSKDL